jgi:hypothetical protein
VVMLISTGISFISCSYRVFPWTNSQLTQWIGIYFLLQLNNVTYFYGSLLDVIILFDRISTFKQSIKAWFKLAPHKICIISLIIVIVVSGPYYFVNYVDSVTFKLDSTENFTVWFFRSSDFAKTTLGSALMFTVYGIRDLGMMILQIILNVISMYLFKRYCTKKAKLTAPRVTASEFRVQETNFNLSVILAPTGVVSMVGSEKINLPSKRRSPVSTTEQKATQMCLFMSLLSIMEHLLVLIGLAFPYFTTDFFVIVIMFNFTYFFWQLKRAIDFFLFYSFNKNFRKTCLRSIRIRL